MKLSKKWLTIIIVVIVLFAFHFIVSRDTANYQRENTVVTNVIDGDTIVVSGGQRVRLLNIDSRERGEDCYNEAKNRLEELIEMKNITMERDVENKDQYDRLLRYIFINNTNVNIQLVREGLAIVYIYEPNVKYQNEFKQAEQLAMQEKTGCLWKSG